MLSVYKEAHSRLVKQIEENEKEIMTLCLSEEDKDSQAVLEGKWLNNYNLKIELQKFEADLRFLQHHRRIF